MIIFPRWFVAFGTVLLVMVHGGLCGCSAFGGASTTTKNGKRPFYQISSCPAFHETRRFAPPLTAFYNDFEETSKNEDDDEEDDDDDDDYLEEDDYNDKAVQDFRSKMSSLFGTDDNKDDTTRPSAASSTEAIDELIKLVRQSSDDSSATKNKEPKEWAQPTTLLEPGTVLVANPARFCNDFGISNNDDDDDENENLALFSTFLGTNRASGNSVNPRLLQKFGLTLPPPADLGPDRRADLLPVLMIVERTRGDSDDEDMIQAVLLNRRTGYLLGDLEQPTQQSSMNDDDDDDKTASSSMAPLLEKFCIQPLWFGGVYNHNQRDGSSTSMASGLDMLHLCPAVPGAKAITDDGLYWGGDPSLAQDFLNDPSQARIYTGFDFKFFVQITQWSTAKELQHELQAPPTDQPAAAHDRYGNWFACRVNKEVLFKSRDRMGGGTRGRPAKPLWTEIMQLLGGEYLEICQTLYQQEE